MHTVPPMDISKQPEPKTNTLPMLTRAVSITWLSRPCRLPADRMAPLVATVKNSTTSTKPMMGK